MGLLGWALGNNDMYELEEGEWIPEDHQGIPESSQGAADEGMVGVLIQIIECKCPHFF